MARRLLPLLLLPLAACATPMSKAAARGDHARIEKLLAQGVDINKSKGDFGHWSTATPLIAASSQGRLKTMEFLIGRGADINQRTKYGHTALGSAAMAGQTTAVRLLLSKGAEVTDDAIKKAKYARNEALARLFEKVYADQNRDILAGRTPDAPQTQKEASVLPTYSSPARPNDFALVVGVGKYSEVPDARFADKDAAAFKAHLLALGVPQRNLIHLTGVKATQTGLKKYIESWLPKNVKPSSRVYFFFSGHGAPNPENGNAYLLPFDGDPSFLDDTAYPLKRLYAKLGALKVRETLVALDACFSGAGGRSVLAKNARPLVTKVDATKSAGNSITLLTAASGNEITSAVDTQGHGTFTYYLLKGLNGAAKDANGRVTSKSLYRYLKPQVQDEARRQNREQTPTLHAKSDVVLRDN